MSSLHATLLLVIICLVLVMYLEAAVGAQAQVAAQRQRRRRRSLTRDVASSSQHHHRYNTPAATSAAHITFAASSVPASSTPAAATNTEGAADAGEYVETHIRRRRVDDDSGPGGGLMGYDNIFSFRKGGGSSKGSKSSRASGSGRGTKSSKGDSGSSGSKQSKKSRGDKESDRGSSSSEEKKKKGGGGTSSSKTRSDKQKSRSDDESKKDKKKSSDESKDDKKSAGGSSRDKHKKQGSSSTYSKKKSPKGDDKSEDHDDKKSRDKSQQSKSKSKTKSRPSKSKPSKPSESKESESKKKKSGTDHKSSDRMCHTSKMKSCRNTCIEDRCEKNDKEDSPCYKNCRHRCCDEDGGGGTKDSRSSGSKEKKKDSGDGKDDDDRMCATIKEKACRSKCYHREKCNEDEDCKKGCRRDCCGSSGSDASRKGSKSKSSKDHSKKSEDGSKTKSKKSDSSRSKQKKKKKKQSNKDSRSSGKNWSDDDDDDSDDDDEPLCNTRVEKDCKNECYDDDCRSGDKSCRRNCRNSCCSRNDSILSILDYINGSNDRWSEDDEDGDRNTSRDADLFTGDLPIGFRFTINTALRITAEDIMRARGNRLKDDLEGGLSLLIPQIVRDTFRFSDWDDNRMLEEYVRRALLVEYQRRKPPTVEDVIDVRCPIGVESGSCKRVSAEATLRIVEEDEEDVRRVFLDKISEAITKGDLERNILQYNPDHGAAIQEEEGNADASTRSEGSSSTRLTPLVIAGIVVASLVFLTLLYLLFAELKDRKRRRAEKSIQGSGGSYDNTTTQDEYGHPRGQGRSSQVQFADQQQQQAQYSSLPPPPPPPQLPDQSARSQSTQIAKIRRELEDSGQYVSVSQYQAEPEENRALERGGPSLTDLVATSYSPKLTTAEAAGLAAMPEDDHNREVSDLSQNEYQDRERAEQSERTMEYPDYQETDYGPPANPDRYSDRDDGAAMVDTSAPIDFRHPSQEENHQEYDNHQQYTDYVEDDHQQYHEQTMVTDDDWGEQKQEIYEEYPDPPVATYTSSGESVHLYEEPAPGVADSDVSSEKSNGGTEAATSSQRYVAMAKMTDEEPKLVSEQEDVIEEISDGSDEDGQPHSQAKQYRTKQADRIGRKSKVSDLINRFESP